MQIKIIKLTIELSINVDEDEEYDVERNLFMRLDEHLKDYQRGEITINRLIHIEDVT